MFAGIRVWVRPHPLCSGLPFDKPDLPPPLLVTAVKVDLALETSDSCRHMRIALKMIQ